MTWVANSMASLLVLTSADRPVDWFELSCPGASASAACAYKNPSASQDMAISLFFQVEDTAGRASFNCKTGDVIHCQRSWAVEEQGSAGTCFFLLGASQEFHCTGTGTVNTIGAHGVHLDGQLLGSPTQELSCKGPLTKCSDKNTAGQDQWVELGFSLPTSEEHALACTVDSHEVCRFSASSQESSSSCAFLLPSGGSLECQATSGAPVVDYAIAQELKQNLTPFSSLVQDTCPPTTGSDPTLCDCSYSNTFETDVIVAISSSNQDGVFNSFHCYMWGANVCAWGANNGESGAAGQCYFILPAGASYSCEMEWGATAFPSVTVLPLSTSIFPSTSRSNSALVPVGDGLSHIPSRRSGQEINRLFDEFQQKHGPVIGRFENFVRYVSAVDNHPTNSPLSSGTQLSRLALLSAKEFEETYKSGKRAERLQATWMLSDSAVQTPSSIDWRDLGAVTPVKDQGQCGSCWSFSTTGVLEGAWAVAGHGLQALSEQQLVSCDNADGNAGCGGGWPYKAIDYVRDNGIDTEESYPYSSASGSAPSCTASSGTKAAVQVTGHTVVESDEAAMAAWVTLHGPLSISVDAMTQLWWPYTDGVLSTCCNTEVDHAVLIAGFGVSGGQPYWLVKNSWSSTWGEQGYIRLERGSNQCGLTYQPVGAIVSGSPTPTPQPPMPTPTPPVPMPMPTPAPSPFSGCPSDADAVVTEDGRDECLWSSGAHGLTIPASATQYCDYITDGYFGYSWAASDGDYACAASAQKGTNGVDTFCTWTDGEKGVVIPNGAVADCGRLSDGRIGLILPSVGGHIQV